MLLLGFCCLFVIFTFCLFVCLQYIYIDFFCPSPHSCLIGARCSSAVRAFAYGAMGRRIDPSWVDPSSYFSFQPVFHDWCNKDRGMCYPVCGMVHIKKPLLLIGNSSLCGGSGFPLSLSEWSSTICPTPYNRK